MRISVAEAPVGRRSFQAFPLLFLMVMMTAATVARGADGAVRGGAVLSRCGLYQLGGSDVVLTLSGQDLPRPEMEAEGTRLLVTLRDTRLSLEKGLDALEGVPLILGMTASQESGDAVLRLTAAKPLQPHSRRGGERSKSHTLRLAATGKEDRGDMGFASPPGPATPTFPGTLPPPGERITLELRDIELQDLFRLLAEPLKKNLIIDSSLPSSRVTLALKDVPVGVVLDYLTRTFGVACCPLGEDTLVVGTRDGLSRLSGEEKTRAFPIAWADPAALVAPLSSLTGLPAGRFVADARLRTLYVTANPWKLEEAAALLERMDQPERQVMIHARIFEFAEGSSREVETAMNAVYDHWWFSYSPQGGARGGVIDDNGRGRAFTGPPSGYPVPGMTDLTTPLEGVWREFDAAFQALETRGRGRTLASPAVITVEGQEARIRLTEEYPYISARDDAGNPTWSTKTVGPQLTLTPRVGRDGFIDLQIAAETGEVMEMITGSTGERMPRTSTRSVTTRIRVRDGEPFVVGGLFHENQTRRRVGVPVLGSIPLLGELFTYRYDERGRTQVVILVIPYILDTTNGE